MTYEEIMNMTDIQEKEDTLIKFYCEEIGIEDWLVENTEIQKIRFKDRFEYKIKGEYHRLTGPAIDFHNESRGFYYLDGEALSHEEWKPRATQLLREFKLKRVITEDDDI